VVRPGQLDLTKTKPSAITGRGGSSKLCQARSHDYKHPTHSLNGWSEDVDPHFAVWPRAGLRRSARPGRGGRRRVHRLKWGRRRRRSDRRRRRRRRDRRRRRRGHCSGRGWRRHNGGCRRRRGGRGDWCRCGRRWRRGRRVDAVGLVKRRCDDVRGDLFGDALAEEFVLSSQASKLFGQRQRCFGCGGRRRRRLRRGDRSGQVRKRRRRRQRGQLIALWRNEARIMKGARRVSVAPRIEPARATPQQCTVPRQTAATPACVPTLRLSLSAPWQSPTPRRSWCGGRACQPCHDVGDVSVRWVGSPAMLY